MCTGTNDDAVRADLQGQLDAIEARWRSVIDSAVDGIIVIDARGRVETFNAAAEKLFGYAASEVIGKNVHMLMPSPYREEHDSYLARYLTTGRAKVIGIGREVQGRRKDGTVFPLQLSVGEFVTENERKFTGIVHDLSERVQLEAQLREQAALARLGEMAAVIAHEVKNPLAGIRGAIQVFGSRLPADEANSRVMKEILTRIDSLDQMMKDLLLFARAPHPKRLTVDIAPLLATTATLLRQDPAFHGISIDVEGTVPPAFADPDMLRIVFQNLILNSAHAMQGQGSIRICVRAVDDRCELSFADSGPGIPDDIREQIFTPFFTTKSRGSGLGLPTAKRLVEAHNGRIAVHCPPSGGTTVVISLPLTDVSARAAATAPGSSSTSPTGV